MQTVYLSESAYHIACGESIFFLPAGQNRQVASFRAEYLDSLSGFFFLHDKFTIPWYTPPG